MIDRGTALDFGGDSGMAAEKLEYILNTGHWTWHGLRPENKMDSILVYLVKSGGVEIYRKEYPCKGIKDVSEEVWRSARMMSGLARKRDTYGGDSINAAYIFREYEYDPPMSKHGALFYPELRAYLRCGGLVTERVLELLETEGCDSLIVLPAISNSYPNEEVYTLHRTIPRENLASAMDNIRTQRQEEMLEAMRNTNHRSIIPDAAELE